MAAHEAVHAKMARATAGDSPGPEPRPDQQAPGQPGRQPN